MTRPVLSSAARRLPRRLGLPGVLGVLLLAGAAWLHGQWLPERQAALDGLGSQARRLRHELAERQARVAEGLASDRIDSPEQAWALLWQGLPDARQRVALQAAVLDSARAHGLSAASVQYQGVRQPWSAREGEVLWRQRLVMPLSGRYADVRAWLATLLAEPALGLDALSVQRQDAGADAVQARVALSLWWRQPEPMKGPRP